MDAIDHTDLFAGSQSSIYWSWVVSGRTYNKLTDCSEQRCKVYFNKSTYSKILYHGAP